MDERMMLFGPEDGLHFRLVWEHPAPNGTPAEATRGWLQAWLAGEPIWGKRPQGEEPGLLWTWIELVEHLAKAWPYLAWEECDPLGLMCDEPEPLRQVAEERWSATSTDIRDREELELYQYIETHDLSSALNGATVAPLWLRREGNNMLMTSRGRHLRAPLAEVLSTLGSLGNEVANRVRGMSSPRADAAVEAWDGREAETDRRAFAIATGMSADDLELPEISAWNTGLAESEYLAAARMSAGTLSPAQVRELLKLLRTVPQSWTRPIDELAANAKQALCGSGAASAYDQGYEVARWFRAHRGLRPEDRVEPEKILSDWGIEVEDVAIDCKQLDAVSVWGPGHGPAILVNRKGLHGRSLGKRATLAHEIAHILLDRADALPVAEVLGGRVSPFVEARARAFAAEFLAPRSAVGPRIAGAVDPAAAVGDLRREFGASAEIIAWQALNSRIGLGAATLAYLRTLLPNQGRR